MSEAEAVYTRDKSSGRIHKRYRVGETFLTDERCNLDDAGDFDIVDETVVADAEPGQLCERDFPQPSDDEVAG